MIKEDDHHHHSSRCRYYYYHCLGEKLRQKIIPQQYTTDHIFFTIIRNRIHRILFSLPLDPLQSKLDFRFNLIDLKRKRGKVRRGEKMEQVHL